MAGLSVFFVGCVVLLVLWDFSSALTGDLNTWQLIIDTITTFLLVALLQNSQRRTERALQAKLNAIADGLTALMEHQASGETGDLAGTPRTYASLPEMRSSRGTTLPRASSRPTLRPGQPLPRARSRPTVTLSALVFIAVLSVAAPRARAARSTPATALSRLVTRARIRPPITISGIPCRTPRLAAVCSKVRGGVTRVNSYERPLAVSGVEEPMRTFRRTREHLGARNSVDLRFLRWSVSSTDGQNGRAGCCQGTGWGAKSRTD